MDDAKRLHRIAGQILVATREGRLKWKPINDESRTHFLAELGDRPIAIWSMDKDDVAPFRLSFGDEDRQEVTHLDSIMGAIEPLDQQVNKNLAGIYRLAKSKGLGVDDYLSDLERELGIGTD
jgi:hypothetical protein